MIELVKLATTAVTSSGFGTLASVTFARIVPAANLSRYGKVAMWVTSTATGLALARATKPATDEYIDEVAEVIQQIRYGSSR